MDLGWSSGGYPIRQRGVPEARIDCFKLGVWVAGLVLPWSGVFLVLRLAMA